MSAAASLGAVAADPFDALAPDYDASFGENPIGRRMRAAVERRLLARFAPGDRVLDLGCGTGEDAVRLARRGVEVVAIDASPAMVAAARAKVAAAGVGERVTVLRVGIEELAAAVPRSMRRGEATETGSARGEVSAWRRPAESEPVAAAADDDLLVSGSVPGGAAEAASPRPTPADRAFTERAPASGFAASGPAPGGAAAAASVRGFAEEAWSDESAPSGGAPGAGGSPGSRSADGGWAEVAAADAALAGRSFAAAGFAEAVSSATRLAGRCGESALVPADGRRPFAGSRPSGVRERPGTGRRAAADSPHRPTTGEAAPSLDLLLGGGFDGVLSDFGAVNCVADLPSLAAALGRLVRPGGAAVLCVMGPLAPWEWLLGALRLDPRLALRRLRPGGVRWRGRLVRYPSPRALRRAFAPWFAAERLAAVGALLPPPSIGARAARHPRLLDRLERAERRCETLPPLPWLADHYLLELVRR